MIENYFLWWIIIHIAFLFIINNAKNAPFCAVQPSSTAIPVLHPKINLCPILFYTMNFYHNTWSYEEFYIKVPYEVLEFSSESKWAAKSSLGDSTGHLVEGDSTGHPYFFCLSVANG